MQAKNSPKIVKIDFEAQMLAKKHKRKVQRPFKKPLSTSQNSQKTIQKQQTQNPQLSSHVAQSLVESQVQKYEASEFSFSEQNHSSIRKIQGPGYEIFYNKKQEETLSSISQKKIHFYQLNAVLKIFQLCDKRHENQQINEEDMQVFSKNLVSELKKRYGGRNEQLILKKESQLRESLKIIFYRKKAFEISELLFYMLDCGIADDMVEKLMEIFPSEMKEM